MSDGAGACRIPGSYVGLHRNAFPSLVSSRSTLSRLIKYWPESTNPHSYSCTRG